MRGLLNRCKQKAMAVPGACGLSFLMLLLGSSFSPVYGADLSHPDPSTIVGTPPSSTVSSSSAAAAAAVASPSAGHGAAESEGLALRVPVAPLSFDSCVLPDDRRLAVLRYLVQKKDALNLEPTRTLQEVIWNWRTGAAGPREPQNILGAAILSQGILELLINGTLFGNTMVEVTQRAIPAPERQELLSLASQCFLFEHSCTPANTALWSDLLLREVTMLNRDPSSLSAKNQHLITFDLVAHATNAIREWVEDTHVPPQQPFATAMSSIAEQLAVMPGCTFSRGVSWERGLSADQIQRILGENFFVDVLHNVLFVKSTDGLSYAAARRLCTRIFSALFPGEDPEKEMSLREAQWPELTGAPGTFLLATFLFDNATPCDIYKERMLYILWGMAQDARISEGHQHLAGSIIRRLSLAGAAVSPKVQELLEKVGQFMGTLAEGADSDAESELVAPQERQRSSGIGNDGSR